MLTKYGIRHWQIKLVIDLCVFFLLALGISPTDIIIIIIIIIIIVVVVVVVVII